MDKRVIKTRTAIFEAFKELLQEKDYSRISVQDIIKKANIGRSTFYCHFNTKDEVLKSLCKDIFHHVLSESKVKEKTHDYSNGKYTFKDVITHILYHIKEIEEYILLSNEKEENNILITCFETNIAKIFKKDVINTDLDIPADYIINHLSCSLSKSIIWWLESEVEYSGDEIAEFFFNANKDLISKDVL